MSHSKLQGYEEVDVDGVVHLFKADFSFLAELKQVAGVDPLQIYQRLMASEGDAVFVRDVLSCSIVSISGADVEPEKRKEVCEGLITVNGLQNCMILAQHMLSYAMIGDKKKYQIRTMEANQKVLDAFNPSQSKSFRSLLLPWACLIVSSGIFACLSSRLLDLLIASVTG